MASPLFETVKKTFDSENWAYSQVEDREVILAGFEARHLKKQPTLQLCANALLNSFFAPIKH